MAANHAHRHACHESAWQKARLPLHACALLDAFGQSESARCPQETALRAPLKRSFDSKNPPARILERPGGLADLMLPRSIGLPLVDHCNPARIEKTQLIAAHAAHLPTACSSCMCTPATRCAQRTSPRPTCDAAPRAASISADPREALITAASTHVQS